MKCIHLLENQKCSLVGHFYSKEGFSLNGKKMCVNGQDERQCKYFEVESGEEEFVDASYIDYEEYDVEYKIEKISKRKSFV
jgi:hypothetical protein